MAADPRPGDRSLADDDRYLFLETLLHANTGLLALPAIVPGAVVLDAERDANVRGPLPGKVIEQLLRLLSLTLVTFVFESFCSLPSDFANSGSESTAGILALTSFL